MRVLRFLPVLGLAALTATRAPAQQSGGQKTLDATDLSFWKSIRNAATSPDGRWFAYVLAPNEGDGEVVVRPTSAEAREWRFPIGEAVVQPFNPFDQTPRNSPLVISGDAKWTAFSTYPTAEETKKLKKDKKPIQTGLVVVNLATGEKRDFEKIQRFSFAGENPAWVAMKRYPAEGATASDLLLLDLRTGTMSTIGSVADYALDETGGWLAWTTEAKDLVGNGVQIRNLATDQVKTIESDKAVYRRLAWADSGLALAVLRGRPDSARGDTVYAVVGITSVGGGNTKVVYEPSPATGLPADRRVSPDRTPRWTADFAALAFGTTARRNGPESKTGRPDVKPVAGTPGMMQTPAGAGGTEDDLPTLVIWHGKEGRLQSQQQVEEGRDKIFSSLALYRVVERKFLALADDELRDVQLTPRDRYGLGTDRRVYERRDNIDGGQRRDYYAIDLKTGARTPIKKTASYPIRPSPDGTKALFYDNGEYHVYDFLTGQTKAITPGAPTTFIDTEDDHNVDRPPVEPLGWSADSRFVLLFDNWDVWRVAATGGSFVNLTGTGKRDKIRFTRRLVIDPKEKGIDLTKPMYLQTYGEWTKKEGLARVIPAKPGAEMLLADDAKFLVNRARDAETWVYTRQTVRDFPDYWVADAKLANPVRLTDANPQQKDYAWSSGAQLVNYVSEKGDSLQGALYLPANYEPGKKYPTVVYIYEKLSQGLHSYAVPNETRAFNPSIYTSRGYAVFQPDIVYRINDPGMSSVWCVVPAVKAAIATGIVDPAKVGLHGHSWGGYQSSFLATQTGKLFSGIVTGAPLTDMISMYNSVYWNTGTADMAIFETSQGRFKGSYLDNHEAYIRNSPAFFVKQIETPVMILHNEKDGAVDFNQGITFFNSLREQDKDVIMLQYVGENHGLQLPKNQKDYTVRMQEYFDHYLKGLPAPDWMKEGVPRLKMEEHLKSRQKKPKAIS
ncbi:MAG: S9 family peptidase [Gemmatimonadetes bacterium]|nr:S9 family peptidase [Gemmatimonadota bacterium]